MSHGRVVVAIIAFSLYSARSHRQSDKEKMERARKDADMLSRPLRDIAERMAAEKRNQL